MAGGGGVRSRRGASRFIGRVDRAHVPEPQLHLPVPFRWDLRDDVRTRAGDRGQLRPCDAGEASRALPVRSDRILCHFSDHRCRRQPHRGSDHLGSWQDGRLHQTRPVRRGAKWRRRRARTPLWGRSPIPVSPWESHSACRSASAGGIREAWIAGAAVARTVRR